ncbi:hypothetical protein O3297_13045 [Janthinobacterium sp. SUN128]|nr:MULTISPECIES: hypothetical protein [Janthinobacterium]MCC7711779.1 hypothetical protein [Janthinobacterium lividum]MDO8034338.1 hypothetical protein [Janthinobacterium sp. SUN128]OEZ46554.1 hypothetical protein JAB1_50360 [Janthinobacterium sp. MP5059B]WQE27524.1 hypothetical protein U0004_21390 [Janthinobacterium lividum]STQ98429.1 Uncharacterised protein [Janthinobacterium lividum]
MDQQRLQAHAAELEQLLARLAPADGEVADLRSALEPLLALAGSGALSAPLPWGDIPGGRYFTEGGLRQYPELEQAFARFRIEATGGESPALRKLRGEL